MNVTKMTDGVVATVAVKLKGRSLAVGSAEPKDLPICMH